MTVPVDRSVLSEVAKIELARRHLAEFATTVDPGFVLAPHVRLIFEHLEAVERGEIKHLAILVPPRHSKTTICSKLLPAWWIGRRPRSEIILASNTANLAVDNSRSARNLVQADVYPFAVRVRDDSFAGELWRTTGDGVVKAVGIGSAVQGRGANLLVVDDPIASNEETSDLALQRQWEWFTADAARRLLPGGHVIISMYRWHDGDLVGRILDDAELRKDFTVLRLPVFAEQGDPLGREADELLWTPSLTSDGRTVGFTREEIDFQKQLDPQTFAAQYELSPVPKGGAIFRESWFRYYSTLPDDRERQAQFAPLSIGPFHAVERPQPNIVIQSLDSAAKTGLANDYSVIATLVSDRRNFYVHDIVRKRVEFPDLVRMVVEAHAVHHPCAIFIEDSSNGTAVVQELRRTTALPIIPVRPHSTASTSDSMMETVWRGSKEVRASAVSHLFESGRVFIRENATWTKDFITEMTRFPAGRHDDQVDAVVLGLAKLSALVAREARLLSQPDRRGWSYR